MLFNSIAFAIFLPVVLALYWGAPPRLRNPIVLVASYFFYGMWDWRFLSLLAISTVVDYTIGRRLEVADGAHARKLLLIASLVVNLGILGIFKYLNFFVDSFVDLIGRTGAEPNRPFLQVVLPVGISFYTFQTLSYTIDVYRRRLRPVRNVVTFATYVAYFPQLVAGPIERANVLLPQLQELNRRVSTDQITSGLTLILLGLFKKVVLADGVADVVDRSFAAPGEMSWVAMGTGIAAFAIQIYGDFSGYTDMARGVSRLMGIELSLNFAQPYLSRNITEFWRRWHISLSNWLRDYLYISLGGNRRGTVRTYTNLMLTMLLGGLWHGASFNFVIWGALHGLLLVIHRLVRNGSVPDRPLRFTDIPAVTITFMLVCAVWVFFRAEDLGASVKVFRAMAFQSGVSSGADLMLVAAAFATMVCIDVAARLDWITIAAVRRRPEIAGALVSAAVVGVVLFSGGSPRPFVYFQF
ncbi:MAG: MBOAT family protein [Acidimicrobiales bacterium]|nr:MBOAT family protein [Acidimicrobiales bacterium]